MFHLKTKKLLILGLFIVPFLFAHKAHAATVEGKWVDRAHIEITKFDISESDLSDEGRDLLNALGGGAGGMNALQTLVNEKIKGVYEDNNILNGEDVWIKNTGCDGGNNQTSITYAGGITGSRARMVFDANNVYLKAGNTDCKHLLENGIDLNLADPDGASGVFARWVNQQNIESVDGQNNPFVQSPGNPRSFISHQDGGCTVRIDLTEDPRGPTTNAKYETCSGRGIIDIKVASFDRWQTNDPNAPGSSGGNGSAEVPKSCDSEGKGILNWMFCGIINMIDNSIQGIGNIVDQMLSVDSEAIKNNPNLYTVWSYFRNLASLLLIVVALVMIVSQAIGESTFFDAYTIKKVLPRLIIAVILIQLSWFIFNQLIAITNGVAYGIEGLMYAPFGGKDAFDFSAILKGTSGGEGLFASAIVIGGAVGAGALGTAGVLSLALTAFVSLMIGFFVLAIRRAVIVGLLLIAPIALVAWILPGTDKWWKLWWETFSKLLLMYPMILLIIAAGRIFAYAVSTSGNSGGPSSGVLSTFNDYTTFFLVIVCYFGPFFLIPKTFQLAGSAFANITGMVNDRGRGLFDRQRKKRAELMDDRRNRASNSSLYSKDTRRGRLGNKAASWVASPYQNAAYRLADGVKIGNKHIGVPGLSKTGQRLGAHIESAGLEQTQKLFEKFNNAGANDKTYRAISGSRWSEFSASTQEKLIQKGLATRGADGVIQGRALKTSQDFRKMSEVLHGSDSETERIASNALEALAPEVSGLYSDPEMSYASIQGAGIMGLAAHGFANGEDIASAVNGISKDTTTGFAAGVASKASLMGAQSRPDVKNGYGVIYGKNEETGKMEFMSGTKPGGARAKGLLKTLASGDMARAKSGFVRDMGSEITSTISSNLATPELRKAGQDAVQAVGKLRAAGMSTDDIKATAGGKELLAKADDYGLALALKDQLFQAASRYTQGPTDTKAAALQLIEQVGFSEDFHRTESRGYDPDIDGRDMGQQQQQQNQGGPGGGP